jgi:hypothetical protein
VAGGLVWGLSLTAIKAVAIFTGWPLAEAAPRSHPPIVFVAGDLRFPVEPTGIGLLQSFPTS